MFWSWWLSGLALAGVALAHQAATGRLLGVSGRLSSLVDRVRLGPPEPAPDVETSALLAALRKATEEQFGADAVEEAPEEEAPARRPRMEPADHLLFLAGLVGGGLASALLVDGGVALRTGVTSTVLPWLQQLGPGSAVLFVGGLCVGFGTRMAGGCTSGHGLSGVSRIQRGSLAATMAFFGAGIVSSLAIGALL